MSESEPFVDGDAIFNVDARTAVEAAKPKETPPPPPISVLGPAPEFYGERLGEARGNSDAAFAHICRVHGESLFCAETGVCLICYGDQKLKTIGGEPKSERMIAIDLGGDRYWAPCRAHGSDTPHYIRSQKCAPCAENGKPHNPRSEARSAGETRYRSFCDTHGETDFHVNSGSCLECFTATGAERVLRHGSRGLRARARRAGWTKYPSYCETHGDVESFVSNGKCSTCFTASGAVRKTEAARAEGNPRAAARRDGRSTYLAECETHGETAFGVVHGKCLTCFTTNGTRRKTRPVQPGD